MVSVEFYQFIYWNIVLVSLSVEGRYKKLSHYSQFLLFHHTTKQVSENNIQDGETKDIPISENE